MKTEELNKLKEKYPVGTKLKLIKMDDIQAPPPGMTCIVDHIDDSGQIHVRWESGSGLALIEGLDKFEIVPIEY